MPARTGPRLRLRPVVGSASGASQGRAAAHPEYRAATKRGAFCSEDRSRRCRPPPWCTHESPRERHHRVSWDSLHVGVAATTERQRVCGVFVQFPSRAWQTKDYPDVEVRMLVRPGRTFRRIGCATEAAPLSSSAAIMRQRCIHTSELGGRLSSVDPGPHIRPNQFAGVAAGNLCWPATGWSW